VEVYELLNKFLVIKCAVIQVFWVVARVLLENQQQTKTSPKQT